MWGPPGLARSETSPFFVDYVPGTVLSENMAPAEGFRDAKPPDSLVDGARPYMLAPAARLSWMQDFVAGCAVCSPVSSDQAPALDTSHSRQLGIKVILKTALL